MYPLATAILQHTTALGPHHDWLIEDPTLSIPQATDARLWTARIAPPPQDWAALRRLHLTILPPHRRIYLDYQGPVAGNRGHVRRVAKGSCHALLWSQGRIVLTLKTDPITLSMQLIRQSGDHWLALVT